MTIGVDPHKQTHSAVAVDELGVELAVVTRPARREGFGEVWRGRVRWRANECG